MIPLNIKIIQKNSRGICAKDKRREKRNECAKKKLKYFHKKNRKYTKSKKSESNRIQSNRIQSNPIKSNQIKFNRKNQNKMSSPTMNFSNVMVKKMEEMYLGMLKETVVRLGETYGFDGEKAFSSLGVIGGKKEKKPKKEKPTMPLPWTGEIKEDWCLGIRPAHELFSQCTNERGSSGFCSTCSKKKNSVENRAEWLASSGKKAKRYANVLEKKGLKREDVEREAARFGLTIPESEFEYEIKGRGRPRKTAATSDTETDGTESEQEVKPDLFAALYDASTDGESESSKGSDEENVDAAAKEAEELAAKEAKAALKAEKLAAKEQRDALKAEKLAAKEQRDALKAEKLAAKEAEKAEKLAAKEQREAEKAEKMAAKEQREAEKAEKMAAKEALKAEKLAAKKAKEAEKLAKEKLKAEKLAAKEQREAEREARRNEKAAKKAAKEVVIAEDAVVCAGWEEKKVFEKPAAAAEKKVFEKPVAAAEKKVFEKPVAVGAPDIFGTDSEDEEVQEATYEEETSAKVVPWTHKGVEYLKDSSNTVYDKESWEELGVWDEESGEIRDYDDEEFCESDEE